VAHSDDPVLGTDAPLSVRAIIEASASGVPYKGTFNRSVSARGTFSTTRTP
jgi:hypothetical protein